MDEPKQNRLLQYKWRPFCWLNALCLGLFLTAAIGAEGLEVGRARRVLMISAQNRFVPATVMLERAVQRSRRDGHSVVNQELEMGLRSIGVPVFDRGGRTAAAMSFSSVSVIGNALRLRRVNLNRFG
jgi:DNA-binding IclR family transcriptional regulator